MLILHPNKLFFLFSKQRNSRWIEKRFLKFSIGWNDLSTETLKLRCKPSVAFNSAIIEKFDFLIGKAISLKFRSPMRIEEPATNRATFYRQ